MERSGLAPTVLRPRLGESCTTPKVPAALAPAQPTFLGTSAPPAGNPHSVRFRTRRLGALRRMLAVTQLQVVEMERQLTAVIYAFRSPGSGATYIGKHQCSPGGWPRRGTGCLPDGYRGSGVVVGHFHRRHGAAVQWRILAVVDGGRDAVNAAERRAIRLARALLGKLCVNHASGGDGLSSQDAKAMWAHPETGSRMRKAHSDLTQSDHWKAANLAAMQRRADDPAWLERNRQLCKSPERNAKIAAGLRAYRAAQAKANGSVEKAKPMTPEEAAAAAEVARQRRSDAAKARWADPVYAAKVKAAQRAVWERPEAMARRSQSASAKQRKVRVVLPKPEPMPAEARRQVATDHLILAQEAARDPAALAKRSASHKALAMTPERRALLDRIGVAAASPESRAKAAATRARNKALREAQA